MKARYINLKHHDITALLAGRKTQMRGIVKGAESATSHRTTDGRHFFGIDDESRPRLEGCFYQSCPYGRPGDLLWCREAFMVNIHPSEVGLTKDDLPHTWDDAVASAGTVHYLADPMATILADGRPWRSSAQMPRTASRLTLEITGVRVERLQDISEEDARAEGSSSVSFPLTENQRSDIDRFRALWNLIHGAGAWNQNPWVWVVEFDVHHCNVDALIKQREAA